MCVGLFVRRSLETSGVFEHSRLPRRVFAAIRMQLVVVNAELLTDDGDQVGNGCPVADPATQLLLLSLVVSIAEQKEVGKVNEAILIEIALAGRCVIPTEVCSENVEVYARNHVVRVEIVLGDDVDSDVSEIVGIVGVND